jgi:hypothetical protein
MLEADSHAKVQLRSKVRGLRAIEREVLDEQREAEAVKQESSPPFKRSKRGSPKRGVGLLLGGAWDSE